MRETKKTLYPWVKEISIAMELYRVYEFPNNEVIRIEKPRTLVVSDNGHRVVDGNFIAHYIPYGWIHLYWENEDKKQYQHFYQRPDGEKLIMKS